jgi:hypothetical protein
LLDGILVLDGVYGLANALALSGQDGLVQAERIAVNGEYAAVGGDTVAYRNMNDIARNEVVGLDFLGYAISDDLGFIGRILLERGNGLFSAALLRNTDDGIENQDGQNLHDIELAYGSAFQYGGSARKTYNYGVHESGPSISAFEQGEDEGYGGGSEKNQDELILELLQNQLPQRSWRVFR